MECKICECSGKCTHVVVSRTFSYNGKHVLLNGLNAYKCEECGEIVFDLSEVKKIEKTVKDLCD